VFNRTGTSHLIAISGLHITMVAGLFAALMFQLWRRSFFTRAALPLLLPAQKAAALAGAAAAFGYVALAGFGVPAQRTLYMVTVVAAALWSGRIAGVSHVLCAALGAVVLLDPWAVLWPGFWLSFGAVAVILYTSVGRVATHASDAGPPQDKVLPWRQWRRMLHAAARTQYAVTLGLVPLTALLFGQISLVGPIANALAIPLVSFAVTPLALAGSVLPAPLSGWLLIAAHALVAWLAQWLAWLSALPLAVWSAPVPAPWLFAGALAGTLWLLAPRGWPLRWLGIAGWLPLLLNAQTYPAEGTMQVTAFDVGQGMALLVETPHHRLLYDTGPAYSPESDGGNRVIVPYLKARGIDTLDGVMISHSDADHSGGALSVFGAVKVGWVASSLPLDSGVVRAAPGHRRCRAGQSWEWDGIRFDMLHPSAASYDSAKWKPNARSCTLKVSLGAQSILLTGDIEAVQEEELVETAPGALRASVLLAPHHGSGTSSTLPFLEAVRPDVALFQVGYRNRYRHPKSDVYERYAALGIKRLRSDDSGAVTVQFGADVRTSEYRTEHARYWYGR
jgi:competence protein ComEC